MFLDQPTLDGALLGQISRYPAGSLSTGGSSSGLLNSLSAEICDTLDGIVQNGLINDGTNMVPGLEPTDTVRNNSFSLSTFFPLSSKM
jgi:hypothetical protein